MSEISSWRRRSRAEVRYCLDVLLRHLDDENALTSWLTLGVPDGTLGKWPSDEQVEPFLDFAEDEQEFDELVLTALRILRRETLATTLTYRHGTLT